MLNQFSNLSCYKEFEMRCSLTGVSKIDVLKRIGYKDNDYYFFVSNDGIFNWFDLKGNHVEEKAILKTIFCDYIPKTIIKCIIPDGVTCIGERAFSRCDSLKEIVIPNSVTSIDEWTFYSCKSLKEITISNSVISIGYKAFSYCESLEEVIFKGKTLEEVKQMDNYPFGIEDESIIRCDIK